MLGNMMNNQLLISGVIEHAEKYHSDAEIVSRTVEGPIHRYTYSDAAKRSANLAQYKTIMQAIDMFYYETGAYPVVGTATGEQLAKTHFVPADTDLKTALENTYGTGNSWMKFMSKVPVEDQHGEAWLIGKAGTKAHVVVAGHDFPADANVVEGEH